ncbi:MAG: hypothetical protein JNL60_09890 [Bacteroidia bacterium]|nr:hypothetical protein [Bacteroidia bacterium]
MTIHLIQGRFEEKEALAIITKMIDVKVKFHEDKIKHSDNEEDIKMRETRIKNLQKELYDCQKVLKTYGKSVSIQSDIHLS